MNEMIMVCHSLINNIRTGLVISLSSNTNLLISLIPQITSNFIHLQNYIENTQIAIFSFLWRGFLTLKNIAEELSRYNRDDVLAYKVKAIL